jgi:hypothetical protein
LLKRDGHSYYWNLPELTSISDDAGPTSPLVLCEDGKLLGPAHTGLEEIGKAGLGRFSHAGPGVTLSTSDNSDPNTNGRSYSAFAFQAKPKGGS